MAAIAASPPIVDCDVHPLIRDTHDVFGYMPASWRQHFEASGIRTYARARDRYNHPHKTYRLDAVPSAGGPAGSDRDFTIANHVEPYHITTALLLPQEPYGVTAWGNSAAATAFCSAVNSYFIENWVAYDDRYALAVTVSAHDPEEAAREIRRHGQEPGVVGIQLLLLEQMMGSRWFDPVYEAACELSLPIVFHQSGNEGCHFSSQTVAGGIPRSYGERHVVLPQVGAANMVDMITSGVFTRFPQLRVVMVEWGFSWVPSLLARMDYLWEQDPHSAPLVTARPSSYVREHFTFTTQPLDEPGTLAELRALFGQPDVIDTLLFSSDYPHYDTDDPEFVLKRIPANVRAKVCYENAIATFGERIFRSDDPREPEPVAP
jgi:predicted TIM-barrel fold metal-dependent hydrolase